MVIFNKKKNKEIYISEKHPLVKIGPQLYNEEYPHILIELKNIDFQRHALTCKDCKTLCDDFGTNTTDWYITWQTKNYRLDLSNPGRGYHQTLVSCMFGGYFTGTRLKLMISTENIVKLKEELDHNLEFENYEHCAFLRDRIHQLEDEQ